MVDLRDSRELQLAEEATAAAARAIAHDPGLRFRGHLLHVGGRVAPARAPHVHQDPETLDLAGLRGSTDAIALRVLHTDPAVYASHRPEGPFAELVYEILEQFRVEALAPGAMPGVRTNVRHVFDRWSDSVIDAGLLENDIGLLLFTVAHVCRSRVLAEPIDEMVTDHTEATRAGVYEVLGQHLLELRPAIGDQERFAVAACQIASSVAEIAESRSDQRSGRRSVTSVMAMLEVDPADDADDDAADVGGGGPARRAQGSDYTVFTQRYDRTVAAPELMAGHALRAGRLALDALVAEHRSLGAYFLRSVHSLFPAPVDMAWESEQEEGRLDPRRLSQLATGSLEPRVFRRELAVDRPRGAVTVLVDCSGSMKAVIPGVAALVDLLTRALDAADVATEVLGFTTGAWNGGRARADWLEAGRPAQPGRLNEVLQVVFKDATTPWRRARLAIGGMLWTPMFREGIDGEAVDWAGQRLAAVDAPRRHLIMVSDGSPMDGATSLANGDTYLDRHLAEALDQVGSRVGTRVLGLGIGHDLSAYLTHSLVVDPDRILHPATARGVVDFLAGR